MKTFTFAQLNDSQKQSLVDNMLKDHPMRLQNTLVEYVLKASFEDQDAPFSYDDITNNVPTGEVCISTGWEEFTEEERDQRVEELEEIEEPTQDIENDIEELNNMYFESYPEIYQWFSCSDWLIRALEEKGQCTLDEEFWGRQTCGQSVVLDNVMQEIAFKYACEYGQDTLKEDFVNNL